MILFHSELINKFMNYDLVAKFFIELRNKGVSLSAVDLDILTQWERNAFDPKFICQIMTGIYLENQKKGKKFPTSLRPIAQHINKVLNKMKET